MNTPFCPSKTLIALSCLVVACAPEKERVTANEDAKDSAPIEKRCEGDAVISNAADLARLSTCTEITGKLELKRSQVVSLDLPLLRKVGSKIVVKKNSALESVRLPALQSVGLEGDVAIERNAALARVDLGGLERIGGGLLVRENPVLVEIAVDGLVEVEGQGIEISGNARLARLAPARLRTADYLTVARCGALTAIELPALEWVLEVAISDNAVLVDIAAPLLVKICADPHKNPARLGLVLRGNESLETLGGFSRLEMLGRKGPLSITDNGKLPTCEATRLADRLAKNGWKGEAELCGNLADDCGRGGCAGSPLSPAP